MAVCKFPRAKPPRLSATEVKALVRYRDGYRCTECGMTARQHVRKYGSTLDVHRVVPGSRYTVKGCATVCRSCHAKMPKGVVAAAPLGLRLPPLEAEALRTIAETEERTHTTILRRALKLYAEQNGHPWPTTPADPPAE